MKKMLAWIKKHIILTICLCVLIFIVPLVLVHVLFKTTAPHNWFVAEWGAGELLAYIAGFEALLGTVILGLVSVYQNDKANATNERLMEMQEEQRRFQVKEKASPVNIIPIILDKKRKYYVVTDDDFSREFDIVNQKYEYFFFMDSPGIVRENGKLYNMVIELENVSDIVLTEIYIDNFKVYDIITNATGVCIEKENIREYNYDNSSEQMAKLLLKPHEKIRLCLKIHMDEYRMDEESFHVNFDLSTMSIYNVIYSANVTLFRNNVIDTVDRVYVSTERSYFVNMPEAVDE